MLVIVSFADLKRRTTVAARSERARWMMVLIEIVACGWHGFFWLDVGRVHDT